jgi:hypothetical protein
MNKIDKSYGGSVVQAWSGVHRAVCAVCRVAVVMLLVCVPWEEALSERVEVKELYYDIDRVTRQARVEGLIAEGNVRGASIKVPSQFVFDGELYKVTEIGDGAFASDGDALGRDRSLHIKSFSVEGRLLRIGKRAFKGSELEEFYSGEGNGPLEVDSGAFAKLRGVVRSLHLGKGTQLIRKDALSYTLIEALSIPVSVKRLHMEAMRGDGVNYVKHLYVNWLMPQEVPEQMIDTTGVSGVGEVKEDDELLELFLRRTLGFGTGGERYWIGKVHIPKDLKSEEAYRAHILWKRLFSGGDVLEANLYGVTVNSDPEFGIPAVLPSGRVECAWGSEVQLASSAPTGYHVLRWESGGETLSTGAVCMLQVVGDMAVTCRFGADTIIKGGVEYVPIVGTSRATVSGNKSYAGKSGVELLGSVTDIYTEETYSVETVEGWSFSGNLFIDSVYIGEGIRTIGEEAFTNCHQLHAVVFPATLEQVHVSAFHGLLERGMDVYVKWEDPIQAKAAIGQWLLSLPYDIRLHVPRGSYSAYYEVYGDKVARDTEVRIWASVNVEGYGEISIEGQEGAMPYPWRVSMDADSVTLVARSLGDHTFKYWSTRKGDLLSDTSHYKFAVENDKELVAVFVPETGVVYVSTGGTGGGYISSGVGGLYTKGSVLHYEAKSNKGYEFDYWSITEGEDTRKVYGNPLSYKVWSDTATLVAVFHSGLHLLVRSTASGKGVLKVTTANGTVKDNVKVEGVYEYGVPVTLEIEELRAGNRVSWETPGGAVLSTGNPYTFILTGDKEIVARLSDLCEVEVEESEGGSVVVRGVTDGHCAYGEVVSVEVTEEAGYRLGGLIVTDGEGHEKRLEALSKYQIKVEENIRIKGDFYVERYKVTCTYDVSGGAVTGLNGERYSYGDIVHLYAQTYAGYRFGGWENVAGEVLSSRNTYDIFVVGDATIRARFVSMGMGMEGVVREEAREGSVQVLTMYGVEVARYEGSVDESGVKLADGVYVVIVRKGDVVEVRKLVVKRE